MVFNIEAKTMLMSKAEGIKGLTKVGEEDYSRVEKGNQQNSFQMRTFICVVIWMKEAKETT